VRLVSAFVARWRSLLGELTCFGLIGILNFAVDTAVYNALYGIGSLKAQSVAAVVSTTMSFLLNRHWTFRRRSRSGLRREYATFFFLNGVGLAITLAVLGAAKYVFGIDDQLATNVIRVFAIGLATLFRFWSYQKWVFPRVVVPEYPPAEEPVGVAR